jgi:hypothetical protein
MTSKQATIGIVASQRQAERILTALEGAGLSKDDVSVLFAGDPPRSVDDDSSRLDPEAGIAGHPASGGARAFRVAIGVVAIPGDGPFVAAGPILKELSGGLFGAGSRSIAGALIGLGVPEAKARHYEEKVKGGRVLVSVHVGEPDERALAKAILEEGRVADISSVGEHSVSRQPRTIPGRVF